MNKTLQKKIMDFLNCSYNKIKFQEDQETFFDQFSYKYYLNVYVDNSLVYKAKFIKENKKTVPLNIYIDSKTLLITKNRNDIFVRIYGDKKNNMVNTEEDMIEVKNILGVKKYCKNMDLLAKHFIYDNFNGQVELEKLSEYEKIIYNTSYSYGQINYLKEKNSIFSAHCFDINSEHPYMLTSDSYVPMRNPIERLIENVEDIDDSKVGVYLVTIEFNELTKYFKPKKKNIHTITNNFIKILRETNTPFKMYKNKKLKYNAIEYYYEDCINLEGFFGYKINKLFSIKNNNIIAKEFLKEIVGKFSEKQEGEIKTVSRFEYKKYQNTEYSIPNDFRFYPFIYDLCRVNMMKYINYCHKHNIEIFRIKADSIHCFKALPNRFVKSNELGQLKYEGYYIEAPFIHVNSGEYKSLLQK